MVVKYNQNKGYMIDLPARDMTEKEWQSYPKQLTQAALKQGVYKLEKTKEVKDGK